MKRNGRSATGERREVDVRRVLSLLRARAHLRPAEPWFPRSPIADRPFPLRFIFVIQMSQ